VKHKSQQPATGPYRAQSNGPNQFTENIDTVLRCTTKPSNQHHLYSFATKILYALLVSPMSHPSNINDLITLKCGDGVPSLGISRRGREVDQSPPSSFEVKNKWSNTSTSFMCHHGVDRDTFTTHQLTRRVLGECETQLDITDYISPYG